MAWRSSLLRPRRKPVAPQQSCEPRSRAKKQSTDALLSQSCDLSDLPVARAFDVSEPQELPLARFQLFHDAHDIGFDVRFRSGHRLVSRRMRILARSWLRRLDFGMPPMIAQQIRRDPEKIVLHVLVIQLGNADAEKAVVAFLRQIVGNGCVAGRAIHVRPQGAGRRVVEGPEALLVHLEDLIDRADGAIERLGLRQAEFLQHGLREPSSSLPGNFLAGQCAVRGSRIVPGPGQLVMPLEQAKMFRQDVRYAARDQKTNAERKDQRPKDLKSHVGVRRNPPAEEQEPDAENAGHDTDLNRPEYAAKRQRRNLSSRS